MPREPNPLRLTHKDDVEAREAEAEAQFEKARIDYMVGQLGLQEARRQAYANAQERTGRYLLTYDGLLEVAPHLPAYLGFKRLGPLHNMAAALLPSLFNQFGRSPIAKAYRRFREGHLELASGRLVGLVFPRNRVLQGLVVHDGHIDDYCLEGTAMVYRDPEIGPLVVQRFATLVAALYTNRHEWQDG